MVNDFEFALRISNDAACRAILVDVTRHVLGHLGYPLAAIDGFVGLIDAARARNGSDAPCDVRFDAHAGELHILVSHGGAEWRTTCPLP